MAEYKKVAVDQKSLVGINREYLDELKLELEKTKEMYEMLQKEANKKAVSKIRLAFLTCFAQFTGMGVGIYGISSWDVVEPMTFMFSAFWLMTGSAFFIRHKVDFAWENAFSYFEDRELKKLIESKGFDMEKEAFLTTYI